MHLLEHSEWLLAGFWLLGCCYTVAKVSECFLYCFKPSSVTISLSTSSIKNYC